MSALEEEIQQNTEAARMPFMQHPDESYRAGSALCAAALEVIPLSVRGYWQKPITARPCVNAFIC